VQADAAVLEHLEPFVGEWRLAASFDETASDGHVLFEWMPGRRFLIERWQAPDPAPDGLAIIGFDASKEGLVQHYFDARGVARVYEMSFEHGVWKLWRTVADFSPLDFSQRFTGTFAPDGNLIEGTWEIAHDHETWERDFDLTYARIA
jgi:hypothetical protein